MDDKTIYNTMVRMAGSWTNLGSAVNLLMRRYGWRRIVLMTDQAYASLCSYAGPAIDANLSNDNYFDLFWIKMSSTPTDENLHEYLSEAKKNARG